MSRARGVAHRPATRPRTSTRSRGVPAASAVVLGLQRAAGNRATAAVLQRQERRPSAWLPTSPTLDIAAAEMQEAFASAVRPLDERERGIAAGVFGSSLDLDRVRIATTSVVATPTTLGDTIRTAGSIDDATLVHELTHVWQFQTAGLRYISCSLAGQAEGELLHGDRNWAYDYGTIVDGARLSDFGPEQQAMLVENAFSAGALDDPPYAALIAELRRARPRPGGLGAAIDERGLGPRRPEPLGPLGPDPRSEELGGTVPQLEWRF
jgi:hypothetical protein